MEKAPIKKFAVEARRKLIADVTFQLERYGITEKGIVEPQTSTDKELVFDLGNGNVQTIRGVRAVNQYKNLAAHVRGFYTADEPKKELEQFIEEIAYTWFNRLIAIRFMEVNRYLPVRVLSSEITGQKLPDLVKAPFSGDLEFTEDEKKRIFELQDANKEDDLFRFLFFKQCNDLSRILPRLFEDLDGSNSFSELLIVLSFNDPNGVVYRLANEVDERWFDIHATDEEGKPMGQVQIIGWMYQYYNTEPKDKVFADLKKNIKISKQNIPAATQLFTPDWIVRYMVENSLGRLWYEGHPGFDKSQWKYYLDEAPQEPEVQAKLATIRKEYAALNPEDLTLIDPCMGSGHILVYAFDVLMQIYESVGYSQRDAAKSILEHNLYGLDIDDRAYQLAYFAVMMRARQYNRRILNGENTCHVHAIQESNPINRAHLKFFGAGLSDLEKNTAKMQLEGLLDILTDAKEYGSILNVPEYNWVLLRRFVSGIDDEVQISLESAGVEHTAEELAKLIDLGETMARKYWVTVTNPPYAGMSKMNAKLNSFVQDNYADYKSDMFSAFVVKCSTMTRTNGYCAFLTPYVWMFIQSYEKMRKYLYANTTIETLIQFEYSAFEEATVPICTFAFRKGYIAKKGCYLRLTDFRGGMEVQRQKTLEAINNHNCGYYFEQYSDNFAKIPGSPVAYWVSEKVRDAFANNPMIDDVLETRNGMSTTNNNLFLRCWFEISLLKCGLGDFTRQSAKQSKRKWFRYNKGGEFRRWFGNNDYVVNWENDGEYLKSYVAERYGSYSKEIRSEDRYFDESITWSGVTSSQTGFRYSPQGAIFDSGANGLFAQKAEIVKYTLGFLNTKLVVDFVKCVNPTINTGSGTIGKLPLCIKDSEIEKVNLIVEECIENSRSDWDSFETSWDFTTHPLVNMSKGLWDATSTAAAMDYFYGYLPEASCPLEICYLLWQGQCKERFEKLKANEEELNRIFIDIYGLQDELTPEVEEKDVTVRKADLQRDIKSLLSYAVGCMFGRYSLDVPGLVLAGQPFEEKFVHASNAVTGTGVLGAPGLLRAPGALYLRTEDGVKQCTFAPDVDNVIPITDEEYLEDDIIARLCGWLKVVYGADTLEANLDYIAKALGNKGTTSREVIRNYFVNDFFKDHCQTYSVTGSGKRPIYWLFDSGKQNGFKALAYLHRYTPDTIGTLRVDYLHKMQRVYESEINRMQDMMDHTTNAREAAAASKRKDKLTKQLKECRDYDEKISHLALSRIALDLDDGVKVNYRKLQTAADGKFYEVLADSKNIMAKEKK